LSAASDAIIAFISSVDKPSAFSFNSFSPNSLYPKTPFSMPNCFETSLDISFCCSVAVPFVSKTASTFSLPPKPGIKLNNFLIPLIAILNGSKIISLIPPNILPRPSFAVFQASENISVKEISPENQDIILLNGAVITSK